MSSPVPTIAVAFDGMRLHLERDERGYRAQLYAGDNPVFFMIAWGPDVRIQHVQSAWLQPCVWLGNDFCIDLSEQAAAAIEQWSASLPPRRAVARLSGLPEAEPIQDAEAIVDAATAQHGAPCDVRC